jgi:hypothetical protein
MNKMNIFQHIKTGKRYLVIGIGRNVEAPEKKMVVYKQLYVKTQIFLYLLERFGRVI